MGNQYQFISDNEILCENVKRHATVSSYREKCSNQKKQSNGNDQFLKNWVNILCALHYHEKNLLENRTDKLHESSLKCVSWFRFSKSTAQQLKTIFQNSISFWRWYNKHKQHVCPWISHLWFFFSKRLKTVDERVSGYSICFSLALSSK